MPDLEHLEVTAAEGELFFVDDIRTDPPTRLGAIGRIFPNGFDDMPRWNSSGTGARFRRHGTPYSTIEGALDTFVGPDDT